MVESMSDVPVACFVFHHASKLTPSSALYSCFQVYQVNISFRKQSDGSSGCSVRIALEEETVLPATSNQQAVVF